MNWFNRTIIIGLCLSRALHGSEAAEAPPKTQPDAASILKPLTDIGVQVTGGIRGAQFFKILAAEISASNERIKSFRGSRNLRNVLSNSSFKQDLVNRLAVSLGRTDSLAKISERYDDLLNDYVDRSSGLEKTTQVLAMDIDKVGEVLRAGRSVSSARLDSGGKVIPAPIPVGINRRSAKPSAFPVVLLVPPKMPLKQYDQFIKEQVRARDDATRTLIELIYADEFFAFLESLSRSSLSREDSVSSADSWLSVGLCRAVAFDGVRHFLGVATAKESFDWMYPPVRSNGQIVEVDPRRALLSSEDNTPAKFAYVRHATGTFLIAREKVGAAKFDLFIGSMVRDIAGGSPSQIDHFFSAFKMTFGFSLESCFPAS